MSKVYEMIERNHPSLYKSRHRASLLQEVSLYMHMT